MTSAQTLLRRAGYIPLAVIGLYGVILGLLTVPFIQREFIFMNRINVPLFMDWDNPVKYGFAPFKVRNVRVETPDGESLGAWEILAKSVYRHLTPFPPTSPIPSSIFDTAHLIRPTILYFHGNAMHRAAPYRLRAYSAFSSQLDCNVLAIDYRGFGDSTGTPSEKGLLVDAHAAWDRTVDKMVNIGGMTKEQAAGEIIIVGHSLGTGVAAGLAGQLANEGLNPRAIVLIAPFSSISDLLSTYKLLFVLPLLGPFRNIPMVQGKSYYLKSFLVHPFNSTQALSNTTAPTLVVHATNDNVIPYSHSSTLFSSVLSLSSVEEAVEEAVDEAVEELVDADAQEPWKADDHQPTKVTAPEVEETTYPGWGVVKSFQRGEGKGEVVWWEGSVGGHDKVGTTEGTLDLIARIARL